MMEYAPTGKILHLLERLESTLENASAIIVAVAFFGGVSWCLITHGAMTMFVTFGHKRALRIMESEDPRVLLIGLFLIPVGLISSSWLFSIWPYLVGSI